jgi:hypothetical protein
MSNTSATGGYLSPGATPAPKEGQELDRFLQQVVVGITGMPGDMVRQRWQAEPPNHPKAEDTWAAVGIMRQVPDTYGVVEHDPAGQGGDTLTRHETLELLCSFYGPDCQAKAARLADGLLIAQNREVLFRAGMGLVGVSPILTVPSLVNERWIKRLDVTVTIRREVRRSYPVLNIVSAGGTILTDTGLTTTFLASEA